MRSLSIIVTFLLGIIAVSASNVCAPESVSAISLSSNYVLSWAPATNPKNCAISGYVVKVYDIEDKYEYQFQMPHNTNLTSYAYTLTNLDMCKLYTFEIRPLTTEFILGPSSVFTTTTPALASMNLTLARHNVTVNNASKAELSWDTVDNKVDKCVTYYRISYWDEHNRPKDVYVSEKFVSLPDLVPCKQYLIEVSALVANPGLDGPISKVTVTGPAVRPDNPQLVNMTTTPTTATIFWRVPLFDRSNCALTTLKVDTTGVGAQTVTIVDKPERPDVKVIVTGLVANHIYNTNVALVNIAGSSDNITLTYQTPSTILRNIPGLE